MSARVTFYVDGFNFLQKKLSCKKQAFSSNVCFIEKKSYLCYRMGKIEKNKLMGTDA
ncbi:hypothetical protein FACS189452_10520 [Bacteroidia bacterium]|nr:hypothetical protein FACS189452_10520 [Bacteroidia bacterium]GHT80174.1 hypothetical protein FACS189467_1640 [Bacteroidia bacterium]